MTVDPGPDKASARVVADSVVARQLRLMGLSFTDDAQLRDAARTIVGALLEHPVMMRELAGEARARASFRRSVSVRQDIDTVAPGSTVIGYSGP